MIPGRNSITVSSFMLRPRLTRQVGPNYIVKVEVRLILHELCGRGHAASCGTSDPRCVHADEPPRLQETATSTSEARRSSCGFRQWKWSDISPSKSATGRDRRVVTVVELLSPSNKTRGPDHDDYLAKRRQVLAGQAHLVEIDLRRGGQRPSPPELPGGAITTPSVESAIRRPADCGLLAVWPARDPLPVLPIPLNPPDAPVRLDLKAVLLDRARTTPPITASTSIRDAGAAAVNAADGAWARAAHSLRRGDEHRLSRRGKVEDCKSPPSRSASTRREGAERRDLTVASPGIHGSQFRPRSTALNQTLRKAPPYDRGMIALKTRLEVLPWSISGSTSKSGQRNGRHTRLSFTNGLTDSATQGRSVQPPRTRLGGMAHEARRAGGLIEVWGKEPRQSVVPSRTITISWLSVRTKSIWIGRRLPRLRRGRSITPSLGSERITRGQKQLVS